MEVVDGEAKPVWGASVTPASGRARRTDSRGRVQVFCFPPEWASPREEQRVIVRAPGYGIAASTPFVPSAEESPPVRVVLEREHRVTGRVLFADDRPARGALVRIRCGDVPEPQPGQVAEDGSFEVSGLPRGPYSVQADLEPDRGSLSSPSGVRPVRAWLDGVTTDALDLVLRFPPLAADPPAAPVEGTVRDAATGRPVLLFETTMVDGRQLVSGSVTGPGAFRFHGVLQGTWTLRVRAPGYVDFRQPGVVVTPPAGPGSLGVSLGRGVALRGTLRRAGGGVLGDTTISFTDWKRSRWLSTWAGSDGSWAESGFLGGESLEVLVRDPEGEGHWMPASGADLVVPLGVTEATVDLPVVPAGIVRFRISSARRSSVSARVEIRDRSGRPVREWSGLNQETRWAALVPGAYTVRVEVPGAGPEERAVVAVGGRTTELTIPIP